MVMGNAAPQDEIKGDMTPMIDVVFQLMIFFMCTIKFKTLEGKLTAYLPKDVGVNTTPTTAKLEKVDIVVKVLKEGTKLHSERNEPYEEGSGRPFRYGPDRLVQIQVGSMITTKVEELAARLKQLHQAQPDRAATIDPKAKTTYADTVLVLNTAVEAGFLDITFKGSYED
ncbi:MAG: biopolymer transporter ExbD [Planctomycetes bacterium]|nr:biopolymer transporter ExbD [Planctomycetota bacterium]